MPVPGMNHDVRLTSSEITTVIHIRRWVREEFEQVIKEDGLKAAIPLWGAEVVNWLGGIVVHNEHFALEFAIRSPWTHAKYIGMKDVRHAILHYAENRQDFDRWITEGKLRVSP